MTTSDFVPYFRRLYTAHQWLRATAVMLVPGRLINRIWIFGYEEIGDSIQLTPPIPSRWKIRASAGLGDVDTSLSGARYIVLGIPSRRYYQQIGLDSPDTLWRSQVDYSVYAEAIRRLRASGFEVVRVGLFADVLPLELQAVGVIDASHDGSLEARDLSIVENSTVVWSIRNGIWSFGRRFRRPVVMTDCYATHPWVDQLCDVWMPAIFESLSDNERLTATTINRTVLSVTKERRSPLESVREVGPQAGDLVSAVLEAIQSRTDSGLSTRQLAIVESYFERVGLSRERRSGFAVPSPNFLEHNRWYWDSN